jgi:hypothetical protein
MLLCKNPWLSLVILMLTLSLASMYAICLKAAGDEVL